MSVIFASYIIIALLSPVAVVGNALIVAAVWKKTFQRTPFHLLLSGLALTDLCAGLITQPFLAAKSLLQLLNPNIVVSRPGLIKILSVIGFLSLDFFWSATLLIITLMSVERWLYMSRRTGFATSRRGGLTARAMLLVIPTATAVISVLTTINEIKENLLHIVVVSLGLFCYMITCVAYLKVFRIIRQHQQQVHRNHPSQNMGQPAINLAKYKKSVASILYILGLFSLSILPITVSLALHVLAVNVSEVRVANAISFVFLFLSSSLNPVLYLWRMRDVRAGVKLLFC